MTTSLIIDFPAQPLTLADDEAITDQIEAEYGSDLTADLLRLPALRRAFESDLRFAVEALRESYPEYSNAASSEADRAAAVAAIRALLPNLDVSTADRAVALIRYAVHVEMKHYANDSFVFGPDYDHELLIDSADYANEDQLQDYGQDANREKWADLVDYAAHHAATLQAEAVRAARPLAA